MKTLFFSIILAVLANTASAGELRSTTLVVREMTCASCPLTVKQILKKQAGVSEATVDYKSQLAQVKFDPEKIRPEQLAKVVTDIGFPTTVKK